MARPMLPKFDPRPDFNLIILNNQPTKTYISAKATTLKQCTYQLLIDLTAEDTT